MEEELVALIIGVEGIGKHTLAKLLQERANASKIPPIKLFIETSIEIPPKNKMHDLYDLIVVMVDQTTKSSLSVVQDLMPLRNYFVNGKICYVYFKAERTSELDFEVDELKELIRSFSAPVFPASKKGPEILADTVFQYLLRTSLLKGGLPPYLHSLKPGWN